MTYLERDIQSRLNRYAKDDSILDVWIWAESRSDGRYGPDGSNLQDVVTYARTVSDPITGYLNFKVSYGNAKIVKTSEDGKVEGITFRVQGNGIDKTVTTNAAGEIQIDNLILGDIIFFDWDKENVGQDGAPDHVGIVEKVENGYVYTVEGNSGDMCQKNRYTVGYYEIFGYGTPSY